ncbi:hypothetical protein GCM10010353_64860 [Streptomyces chryseus]|nr:hypothetical protein GCM10010353_64860 [Streptomyces chryseus]
MVSQAGSVVMRLVASMPLAPGMRMSIRTTSGRSSPALATASLPSTASHDVDVGLGAQEDGEALADHHLVVGDQYADRGHAVFPVGGVPSVGVASRAVRGRRAVIRYPPSPAADPAPRPPNPAGAGAGLAAETDRRPQDTAEPTLGAPACVAAL